MDFIKCYNDENDEPYFFEVDVKYPGNIHHLHECLPFLPERMKIEKIGKLVANLTIKNWICNTYKKSKTSIKPWISLEKVHRIIKFNKIKA